jgi:hypothetical protein
LRPRSPRSRCHGLYPLAQAGARLDALAPETLWAALGPVLVGVILFAGLWLWGQRLPRAPEGDIVVIGETALRKTAAFGGAIERVDDWLRQ